MTNIQEQFKTNEPLSAHTTNAIGGPADMYFETQSQEVLIQALKFAKEQSIPYIIMAGGSNILFHDNGFRGLVIKIASTSIKFEDQQVTADAGVPVAQLLMETLKNNYSGLEKWIGLPGTIGGAVRGNAGCNGLETKDILICAALLNPQTLEIHTENADFFQFSYRHSILKENPEIVLSATFRLKKSLTPEEQKRIMREIQQFRLTQQPKGPSSGSFFKNPSPDKPAGMLIDQAGLKGTTHGKAQISELHGNFILNLEGATAKDVLHLANLAKETVKSKFDITLEEEVQIVPEHKT